MAEIGTQMRRAAELEDSDNDDATDIAMPELRFNATQRSKASRRNYWRSMRALRKG
jgi:hypothetical protein